MEGFWSMLESMEKNGTECELVEKDRTFAREDH
jgi:hypothetical protein